MLRSPEVAEGGTLPKEFTGDGRSATLPLEWSGAPAGTRSFAVIMHHIPGPGTTKWYWVLYNIPADVTSLPKNVTGDRNAGQQQRESTMWAMPRRTRRAPGAKKYTYTVYALSAAPKITVPPRRSVATCCLAAMKDSILASAELNVIYTRDFGDDAVRPRRQVSAARRRDGHRIAATTRPVGAEISRSLARPPTAEPPRADPQADAIDRFPFPAGTPWGCSRTIPGPARATRSSPPSITR